MDFISTILRTTMKFLPALKISSNNCGLILCNHFLMEDPGKVESGSDSPNYREEGEMIGRKDWRIFSAQRT